eukprot:505212-Amphidinium_carterae.1
MKKPTESSMGQLREKVMAGHDNVAGMSASSMDGMATGILANLDASGGGLSDAPIASAVAGEGLCSISLRQQIIQPQQAAKKGSGDAMAAPLDEELGDDGLEWSQDQRAEDGESNPKKPRKEKYFESDRVVAMQIAAMRGSIAAWKAECATITSLKNSAAEELLTKLVECRGMEKDPVIAPVLDVLNSRMRALALVTDPSSAAQTNLASYLGDRALGGDGEKAPPIQKYMDLLTLDTFESNMETAFRACQSQRDLAEAKRQLKSNSAAITELIAVCKSLVKDLQKTMKNASKLKDIRRKLSAGAEGAVQNSGKQVQVEHAKNIHPRVVEQLELEAAMKRGPFTKESSLKRLPCESSGQRVESGQIEEASLWERATELGTAMTVFKDPVSLHDKTLRMNVASPFIVSSVEFSKREEFIVASELFKKKWMTSERRTVQKRAGRMLADDDPLLSLQVARALRAVLPEKLPFKPKAETMARFTDLEAILKPQHFAQAAGETFAYLEPHGIPCLRLHREGSKTVVVTLYPEVVAYMKAVKKIADQPANFTQEKVCEFARNMSQEDLYSLTTSGSKVWHGTVGVNDLLYVPSNAILAEAVMAKHDILGVKLNVFVHGGGDMSEAIVQGEGLKDMHAAINEETAVWQTANATAVLAQNPPLNPAEQVPPPPQNPPLNPAELVPPPPQNPPLNPAEQ